MKFPLCAFILNILLFSATFCSAIHTITPTQSLKDPDRLVSNNSVFSLGFFSLPNSTNRYVGIWYNHPTTLEVIWVANRNNPLNDSYGVVKLAVDGILQVSNARNETLWSSNVTSPVTNFSMAQLTDDGNLVIQGFSSNATHKNATVIWQSFHNPTDCVLPNMTVPLSPNSDLRQVLQAWRSPSDPSVGRFSVGANNLGLFQMIIYDGDRLYWRSGPWNGTKFMGIRYPNPGYGNVVINTGSFQQQEVEGKRALIFAGANASLLTHYVLTYDGTMAQRLWDDSRKSWEVSWHAPDTDCDVYAKCGNYGFCSPHNTPICSCLKGFEPKNKEEWKVGNWTSGCQRRKPLQCRKDGFYRLGMIKVPENAEIHEGLNMDRCRSACFTNCSCLAYAYDTQISCLTWSSNLIDVTDLSPSGIDLYIRLPHSELRETHRWKIVIAILAITGIIAILSFAYAVRRWMIARYGHDEEASMHNIIEAMGGEAEFKDLPLLKFEQLVVATNNFHLQNKLGQGGFGPVYKGTLEDGKEIAVKRLSKASGQGLKEFLNEVIVISKLQHKNLVKLLGCSIEKEEKLLVYEFMQNKSLDVLLFDPNRRENLDWKMRFEIIKGVCRGVLYLHRDSRLKIIHRDLKASNILLDKEFNPKISDFGMARIFGGKQDQANTLRVVGTYGYMSPEYAMEGRFSEKSDVFSLGVLMLEIVSGRRNSSIQDDSIGLISYAWKLWNEDNALCLVDPIILDLSCQAEILRSIHIGLLCVQEFPEDRPNISTVIQMLDSEDKDFPRPLQPAFTLSKKYYADHDVEQHSSINYESMTSVHGR